MQIKDVLKCVLRYSMNERLVENIRFEAFEQDFKII